MHIQVTQSEALSFRTALVFTTTEWVDEWKPIYFLFFVWKTLYLSNCVGVSHIYFSETSCFLSQIHSTILHMYKIKNTMMSMKVVILKKDFADYFLTIRMRGSRESTLKTFSILLSPYSIFVFIVRVCDDMKFVLVKTNQH